MEKLGKLRYSVRLDDGRVWERHTNQMMGVAEDLPDSNNNLPDAQPTSSQDAVNLRRSSRLQGR